MVSLPLSVETDSDREGEPGEEEGVGGVQRGTNRGRESELRLKSSSALLEQTYLEWATACSHGKMLFLQAILKRRLLLQKGNKHYAMIALPSDVSVLLVKRLRSRVLFLRLRSLSSLWLINGLLSGDIDLFPYCVFSSMRLQPSNPKP